MDYITKYSFQKSEIYTFTEHFYISFKDTYKLGNVSKTFKNFHGRWRRVTVGRGHERRKIMESDENYFILKSLIALALGT